MRTLAARAYALGGLRDLAAETQGFHPGVLSAVVDNVPIMFAVLQMSPEMSHGEWLLVTLTAGVGGSLLSIRVRAFAEDATSRAGLLAAWPVLGPLAEQHAKRTLRAVAEFADRFPEEILGVHRSTT